MEEGHQSWALVGEEGFRGMRTVLRLEEPWILDLESGGSARLVLPAGCLKLCSATMNY